jgi:hypothetical protein
MIGELATAEPRNRTNAGATRCNGIFGNCEVEHRVHQREQYANIEQPKSAYVVLDRVEHKPLILSEIR